MIRGGVVRLNPEIDDLLDWLQISTEGLDYEMQNSVLESLLCHEEILLQRLKELQGIMARAGVLQGRGVAWAVIRRYVRSRMRDNFRERIAVRAHRLDACFKQDTQRKECLEEICGITPAELVKYAANGGEIQVELAGLIASRSGLELLRILGLESICLSGRYSLRQLRQDIRKMFASVS